LGVIPSVRLALPVGVSSAPNAPVYITAIRFEYGAVKVGFTSKNYAETTSLNKDYRDSNGVLASPNNLVIQPPTAPVGTGLIPAAVSLGSLSELSLRIATQGAAVPLTAAIVPLAAKGTTNDWTPDPILYPELVSALGHNATKETSPLRPATYLVHTTRAMSNEDIVSSASAQIALDNRYDKDQDRVLTREIVTFTLDPKPPDFGSIVEQDSFVTNANNNGIVFRGGHWVDRNGNQIRIGRGGPAGTADVMALGTWFAVMAAAVLCLILLRLTYAAGGRKRRRETAEEKGGALR
jgi:hypothetical protein